MPTNTYSPYFAPGHLVPALLGPDPSSVASPLSHAVVPQGVQVAQQKIPRSDRLEVSHFNYFFFNFYKINFCLSFLIFDFFNFSKKNISFFYFSFRMFKLIQNKNFDIKM